MSEDKHGRSRRDQRRRNLGQNFLVDRSVVDRFIRSLDLTPGELVVEPGAGTGALTLPLARAGVRVIALEQDPVWARRLGTAVERAGLAEQVDIVVGDLFGQTLPLERHRVVANPPFGLTTALLAHLLDRPERGPERADLIIQAEVAIKRAAEPAATLRSAAWAPWWQATLGFPVPRHSFRPVPSVEAAVLTYRRRRPPILPERLAPGFLEVLRPCWERP